MIRRSLLFNSSRTFPAIALKSWTYDHWVVINLNRILIGESCFPNVSDALFVSSKRLENVAKHVEASSSISISFFGHGRQLILNWCLEHVEQWTPSRILSYGKTSLCFGFDGDLVFRLCLERLKWFFVSAWHESNVTFTVRSFILHECLSRFPFNWSFVVTFDFLGVLPDALRTRCARCTKVQKTKALDVITRLYYQHPSIYTALAERYDPTGEYTRNFENWFDEQNAVKPRPLLPQDINPEGNHLSLCLCPKY